MAHPPTSLSAAALRLRLAQVERDEEWCLLPTVANELCITVDALRYLRKSGKGPLGYSGGGRLMFRMSEALRWYASYRGIALQDGG